MEKVQQINNLAEPRGSSSSHKLQLEDSLELCESKARESERTISTFEITE